MLFESDHITVTADHGIATLSFGFDGEPANALDVARLRELEAALDAVRAGPTLRVLVIRSANPAGFCAGLSATARSTLTHPTDRAAFAWYGQHVMERLASLDVVSIAYIDGQCFGAGFELALACDYRLCVTSPATPLGFPERFTCFGGSPRLREISGKRGLELLNSGRIISGRVARALGLIDVACSERRAKIELRACIDRVKAHAVKRGRSTAWDGLAEERRAFSAAPLHLREAGTAYVAHRLAAPEMIGLLGNDAEAENFIAAATLLGASSVVYGDRSGIFARICESRDRGFITPLETERIRLRVRVSDSLGAFSTAGLVFVAAGHNPFRLAAKVSTRTVICVVRPTGSDPSRSLPAPVVPFPFPSRLLHISFCGANRVALFPDATVDPAVLALLTDRFKLLGYSCMVFPAAARLLPRAA